MIKEIINLLNQHCTTKIDINIITNKKYIIFKINNIKYNMFNNWIYLWKKNNIYIN